MPYFYYAIILPYPQSFIVQRYFGYGAPKKHFEWFWQWNLDQVLPEKKKTLKFYCNGTKILFFGEGWSHEANCKIL